MSAPATTAICRSQWQHDPAAPAPGYKVPRVWGIIDGQLAEDRKKP